MNMISYQKARITGCLELAKMYPQHFTTYIYITSMSDQYYHCVLFSHRYFPLNTIVLVVTAVHHGLKPHQFFTQKKQKFS